MSYQTTVRQGKRFVLVPEADFKRMSAASAFVPLPPIVNGTREALPFARASIANTIIAERKALGWTQVELARQARVNVETLNRIEKARVTADQRTIERIDRALKRGAKA